MIMMPSTFSWTSFCTIFCHGSGFSFSTESSFDYWFSKLFNLCRWTCKLKRNFVQFNQHYLLIHCYHEYLRRYTDNGCPVVDLFYMHDAFSSLPPSRNRILRPMLRQLQFYFSQSVYSEWKNVAKPWLSEIPCVTSRVAACFILLLLLIIPSIYFDLNAGRMSSVLCP